MNWQKSSRCSEGASCVHIAAATPTTIHLTESSAPAVLTTTATPFAALLATLKKESPRV